MLGLMQRWDLDLELRDDAQRTPLYVCAQVGNLAVLDALLARGANPDVLADGVNPLQSAAYAGHSAIVRRLLALDHPHLNGSTRAMPSGNCALHFAAFHGRIRVAEVLLAAGADPDARNEDGWTAAEIADDEGNPEFAVLLRRIKQFGSKAMEFFSLPGKPRRG